MGRLSDRFAALRDSGETALIPFVTAGDPDLPTTEAILMAVIEAGADVVEIGVPFSDPLADGPTIQRATQRALKAGSSLRKILELVARLRPKVDVPLVLMGYANVLMAMGEKEFASAARKAGVDGVITVDLPPEEGSEMFAALEEVGVDSILLASPTTEAARMAQLVEQTRGFLYYVSLTGVTAARPELATGIEEAVEGIKRISDIPVCVGFGVSTPDHAREIGRFADGVVVGSALLDRIEAADSPESAVDVAARFVADLKRPLR